MGTPYDPQAVESHWQARWEEAGAFRAGADDDRPKRYVLDMFPYPSGSPASTWGTPRDYTDLTDIGLALQAQEAASTSCTPWVGTPSASRRRSTRSQAPASIPQSRRAKNNVDNLPAHSSSAWARLLLRLGSREVNTTDPRLRDRWTQWIFLQIYNSYYDEEAGVAKPVAELEAKGWTREQIDAVRLAYVDEAPVNWSPTLGSVHRRMKRSRSGRRRGTPVERRPLRQWMLKHHGRYAERLHRRTRRRSTGPRGSSSCSATGSASSEGAEVVFDRSRDHRGAPFSRRVPTRSSGRPTCVLAPEHPLVDKVTADGAARRGRRPTSRKACATKSDLERDDGA